MTATTRGHGVRGLDRLFYNGEVDTDSGQGHKWQRCDARTICNTDVRICVIISKQPMHWQVMLAELLKADGNNEVEVLLSSVDPITPPALTVLLAFEALVYRTGGERLVETVDRATLPIPIEAKARGHYDLVISLAGGPPEGPNAPRHLTPLFDGHPTVLGAVSALLDRRQFSIGLVETSAQGVRRFLCPAAIEDRRVIGTSLANVCSRVIDLILNHLQKKESTQIAHVDPHVGSSARVPTNLALCCHWLEVLARRLVSRLTSLVTEQPRWVIGWRELAGDAPIIAGQRRDARYHIIPDTSLSYFADPFLHQWNGQLYLFCEEYSYATGKGIVSLFTKGEDGTFCLRGPVLEMPYHLSYPQVFEHVGNIWMLPESGGSGRVDLYRADRFPDRWRYEATLIDGINAYDATLHHDEDGFWLIMTTAFLHSSPSDSLSLYHAKVLTGPWERCSSGPLLIDASRARPGGKFLKLRSGLHRLAQDCSRSYGGALNLTRIEALDQNGIVEKDVGRLAVADRRFCGLHSYDCNGRLEVIDVFGAPAGSFSVTARYSPLGNEAHPMS